LALLQTDLKKTTRWRKYVKSKKDGKSVRCNGIRRQNVAEHTLSKAVVFTPVLPLLEKIFGNSVDFNLLNTCIVYHDFGEGLKGDKYDVLAEDKKHHHDVEEYLLFMKFMNESPLHDPVVEIHLERSFLLHLL
jgi:5'-deoxynucleotidase YfbR-like HD superfamily hydrolase